MKTKIILFILLAILIVPNIISLNSEPKTYYKITLHNENGSLIIKNIDIDFYKEEMTNNPGKYSLVVKSFNDKIVSINLFSMEETLILEEMENNSFVNSQKITKNQTEFDLYIPYNENTKEITIYDPKAKILLKQDINEYSKASSNQIEDNTSQINKNPPSIPSNLSNSKSLIYIILILIIILLIIIFYITRKSNKKK